MRVDVAGRAAADAIRRRDDRVLGLGRHHAAPAVAELQRAADVVERVVPAARGSTRRSCRRDCHRTQTSLFCAFSGSTLRTGLGAEIRDLVGVRLLALANLDDLVVEQRLAQEPELLQRRAVGAAQRLAADGLLVERVDRVRDDHA